MGRATWRNKKVNTERERERTEDNSIFPSISFLYSVPCSESHNLLKTRSSSLLAFLLLSSLIHCTHNSSVRLLIAVSVLKWEHKTRNIIIRLHVHSKPVLTTLPNADKLIQKEKMSMFERAFLAVSYNWIALYSTFMYAHPTSRNSTY